MLPSQQEHSLLSKQVPRPPGKIDLERMAEAIERDAGFDTRVDLLRERYEIRNCAKMDVRRVVLQAWLRFSVTGIRPLKPICTRILQ